MGVKQVTGKCWPRPFCKPSSVYPLALVQTAVSSGLYYLHNLGPAAGSGHSWHGYCQLVPPGRTTQGSVVFRAPFIKDWWVPGRKEPSRMALLGPVGQSDSCVHYPLPPAIHRCPPIPILSFTNTPCWVGWEQVLPQTGCVWSLTLTPGPAVKYQNSRFLLQRAFLWGGILRNGTFQQETTDGPRKYTLCSAGREPDGQGQPRG